MNVTVPPRPARRFLATGLALALASSACARPAANAPVTPSSGAQNPDPRAPHAMVAAAASAASEEPVPPPAATGGSMTTTRAAGWVVLAVGAEALAVAITTSIMMLHDKGVRDDNCDGQKRCTQAGLDANNQIDSLSTWNAAAWVVGAAGLGVGTLLVIMGGPKSERQTALGVSPNGSGMGLQLRSTF